MKKLLLFSLLLLAGLGALAQTIQPHAMRFYWQNGHLIMADSLGTVKGDFVGDISITGYGSKLIAVRIGNATDYYRPTQFLTQSGEAYSAVSVDAAMNAYVLNVVSNGVVRYNAQSGALEYRSGSNWIAYNLPTSPAASILTFLPVQALSAGATSVSVAVGSNNSGVAISLSSSNTAVVSTTLVSGTWYAVPKDVAGTAVLTATQAAGNNFSAAFPVQQTVTVVAPIIVPLVTEKGTTPTSSKFSMQGQNNVFTLYTGSKSSSMPGYTDARFPIYISFNSAAPEKIITYRNSKLLVHCNPGDDIKISSDSIRTFSVNQLYHNSSLTAPSGLTTVCPTDKVGSDFFTASSGHMLMPRHNSAFVVKATGARTIVFVREKDANGTLGGVTTYITEPNRDITIQTSNRRICLGTTAGVSLTIVAPTGTVFDGTSKDERVIVPTPTATLTVVAGSESDLRAKIAQAVSGQRILVTKSASATTTYALTQIVSTTSFVANIAAGFKGAEGIQIVSESRDSVFIKPLAGGWTIDNSTATRPTYLINLNFDETGGGETQLQSGVWRALYCKWNGIWAADAAGTGVGNHLTVAVNNAGNPVDFVGVSLTLTNGSGDLFNGSGNTLYPAATAASSAICLDCTFDTPGLFDNSQAITTHGKLKVYIEGGSIRGSGKDGVANEQGNHSYTYLYYTKVSNGGAQQTSAFGCELENINNATSGVLTNSTMHTFFNYIKWKPTTSFQAAARNAPAPVFNNIIEVQSGAASGTRGFYWNTNSDYYIIGNVVVGTSEAVMSQSFSSTATATQYVYNNTLVNNTTAFSLGDANATFKFGNNATKGSGTGLAGVTASNTAKYISDVGGNIINPPVSVSLTLTSSDSKTANAALDANYIPVVGGNCDATGVPNTTIDYIGDQDPYRQLRTPSRFEWYPGSRSIPRNNTNARLWRDVY